MGLGRESGRPDRSRRGDFDLVALILYEYTMGLKKENLDEKVGVAEHI